MRIAIVTHGFPPKETTGTEWHSYLLARELSRKHSVYVFSRGAGGSYEEYTEEFDGIPVKRINTPTGQRAFLDTYIDDRVALSFSEFLEDSEPDLVHVQHCIGLGLSILEVAIKKRIPTILFLHDFYLMCHRVHLFKPDGEPCAGPRSQGYCSGCIQSYNPSLSETEAHEFGLTRYRHVRGLLSRVDQLLVPSEFVKEVFQANFPAIGQISVSPLGLGLEFTRDFQKKESGKLRFGYFGSICPHKGVHILIEAFKGLKAKNVELRIHGIGDPNDPNYLKVLHERAANGNISFFGPYSQSELSRVLSEIDVFVMPSTCHESFSLTIREALAVGIPVIVSDVRAQSDAVVEEVNGLHFKSGNPHDLGEKLALVAERPHLLRKLSNNARRSAVRAIETQAKELERLYRRLTRAAGSRRSSKVKQAFPRGRVLVSLLSYIRSLEDARRDRLKPVLIQQFTDPMGKLLALYLNRPDLKSSFPEAGKGDYSRLLQWARDVLAKGHNGASHLLADCAEWYKENDWLELPGLEAEKVRLMEDLSAVSRELARRESIVQNLETEKTRLEEDLAKAKYDLSSVLGELGEIKESFGYHMIRFYAGGIDKVLPEGTRRGEFRKKVVAAFGIMAREGVRSLLRQAWKKPKKREHGTVERK